MKKYNIERLKEKIIETIKKKGVKDNSYEVDIDESFLETIFNIDVETLVSFIDV